MASTSGAARTKLHGWEFWNSIGCPKYVCAPMVDGSDLPFRMLTRKYGATLAYTPMFHSRIFGEDPKYRQQYFTTCPEDRPLFTQFCANDPEILLKAARHVEAHCDAVDINFGCPQHIAKRGHYGAFLLEEPELCFSLVRILHENLSIPVTAKIRLLPKLEDTIALAKGLEEAGASVIAIHGRTKEQKKQLMGLADWDQIKAVRDVLNVPVISNGNVRDIRDVEACFGHVGCQGVMSAESLLANPALFSGLDCPSPVELSKEYIELCAKYPVPDSILKGHMFWQLNPTGILAQHVDLRTRLHHAPDKQETHATISELLDRIQNGIAGPTSEKKRKKDQGEEEEEEEEDPQYVLEF